MTYTKKEITDDQVESVLSIMESTNEKAPLLVAVIARRAGIIEGCITYPHTRAVLKRLNMDGYPVVSSSRGFWMAHTPEEIRTYIDSLQARADAITARIDALKAMIEAGRSRGG